MVNGHGHDAASGWFARKRCAHKTSRNGCVSCRYSEIDVALQTVSPKLAELSFYSQKCPAPANPRAWLDPCKPCKIYTVSLWKKNCDHLMSSLVFEFSGDGLICPNHVRVPGAWEQRTADAEHHVAVNVRRRQILNFTDFTFWIQRHLHSCSQLTCWRKAKSYIHHLHS